MKKLLALFITPLLFLLTLSPALASAAPVPAPIRHGSPRIHLRNGTSTNWSGYAAYGKAGSFNSISSTWTQPNVTCTSQNTYSSYWVGLDGYNTNTVEQLGTEADCSNGAPSFYVWYEMYPKFGYYVNIPIEAGNSFSASVTYSGRNTYTLSIKNNTLNMSFTTKQKSSQAKRASAEAILEAPYSGGILPLANFGTANFSNTLANSKPIGDYKYDAITMDNPYGMTSTPSALSGGADFSLKWSNN